MYLRFLATLIVIVLGILGNTAGFAETTRIANELIGPVRSVTIKKLGYSTTETYDRAGHLVEAVVDIPHANTVTHSLFQYDQNGHLQEELALDRSGKLMFRKRIVHARDSQGRATASVTTSDEGGFDYAEFSQYDQRGHLWEQLWVNHSIAHKSLFDILGRRIYSARYSRGKLFSELRQEYDAQGRLHKLVLYNAQGVVVGQVMNNYDDMGRRVRATTETFDEDQQQKWLTVYEFDDMGNWIKELTTEESCTSRKAPISSDPIVQERQIQYYSHAKTKLNN